MLCSRELMELQMSTWLVGHNYLKILGFFDLRGSRNLLSNCIIVSLFVSFDLIIFCLSISRMWLISGDLCFCNKHLPIKECLNSGYVG